jgi:hypothetical protein
MAGVADGAAASCSDGTMRAFLKWFEAAGGELLQARVALMDYSGWGVVATAPIAAGEPLLSVPLKWCLDTGRDCIPSAQACKPSPAWPRELQELVSDWADEDVLALRLISERLADAASPWAPWLRSLPRAFDMPLFWPAEHRPLLQGTNVGALTDLRERQLQRDWEGLFVPLVESLPDALFESVQWLSRATFADYGWAMGVVWSRAFGLTIGGEGGGYVMKLVPVLDILNSLPPAVAVDNVADGAEGWDHLTAGVRSLDGCFSFDDTGGEQRSRYSQDKLEAGVLSEAGSTDPVSISMASVTASDLAAAAAATALAETSTPNGEAGRGVEPCKRLVVRAAHGAGVGEELFVSYGGYGDAKLLFSYG